MINLPVTRTDSVLMKRTPMNKRAFSVLIFGVVIMCPPLYGKSPFPQGCWGVYSWPGWSTNKVTRERCPLIKGAPIILKWNQLEPEPGNFAFDEQLGDKLSQAAEVEPAG